LVDKGIYHYLDATKKIIDEFPIMKGNVFLAGYFWNANLKSNSVDPQYVAKWEDIGGAFLGKQDDKKKFYSSIDIICLPSFREGLSNVLLEAALHGCIIVTTKSPGCIDVVKNEAGITCSPRSTISLYRAIKKAITLSESEQVKFRRNAIRNLKNNFSRDKVLKNYLNILNH